MSSVLLITGIALLVMIVVVRLHSFSIEKRNGHRREYKSGNYNLSTLRYLHDSDGPFSLPGNHEKEIIDALLPNDPYFNKGDFIQTAQCIFIGLQKAESDGSFLPVRQYLSDNLYHRRLAQFQEFIDAGLLPVIDDVQIQRCTLYLYERFESTENLTVFLSAAIRRYLLDRESGEIVNGNETDILQLYYFLTFQRKIGVLSTGKSLWDNCPRCGTSLKVTDSGDCGNCFAHLTAGDYGWTADVLSRITNFSDIDERGIVIHNSL